MRGGRNSAALILDDRGDGIFRVHRSVFVDPEILEQERALVFDRCWLFAGHASEFPNPGDFVTRSVAGRPLILVHGEDGEIRALLNTCRHRGNLVCRENKGTGAEVFRCFYHGWIYNTRGELRGIPGEDAYSDAFDRDALGLEPVPRMHNFRGCIFISFDPEIESFESYMGDALKILGNTLDLGEMEFVEGQFKYSMRANWKLLVENSMDGYHAAYTHERFFNQWMPSEGLGTGFRPPPPNETAPGLNGTVPLGNGHVTTSYPSPEARPAVYDGYLEKHAKQEFAQFREGLVRVAEGVDDPAPDFLGTIDHPARGAQVHLIDPGVEADHGRDIRLLVQERVRIAFDRSLNEGVVEILAAVMLLPPPLAIGLQTLRDP